MGGYVVTIDNGNDYRNFLMVNNADPKSACDEANQWVGMANAEALTPISEATIAFFEVVAGKPWLFTTAHSSTGKVTSSMFTDEGRRRGLQ